MDILNVTKGFCYNYHFSLLEAPGTSANVSEISKVSVL